MKNYDPNIRRGSHTIKVSFQRWNYKEYVTFVKSSNRKGLDMLELEVDDLYNKKFRENPTSFRLPGAGDDDEEWFAMTLESNKDELFIEDKRKYLKGYILGIEIIDFKQGKRRSEYFLTPLLYIERLLNNNNQVITDIKLLLTWEQIVYTMKRVTYQGKVSVNRRMWNEIK